ncbi:MAG: YjbH domain-containing protein [Pseudomonadota bacterium]
MSRLSCVLCLGTLISVSAAKANPETADALSYGDWGGAGVLQTPSARFAEAGEASFTLSHTEPYTRMSIMLQPFDWMETGFRYIDIANRDFGPVSTTGQSLKDKSIDARFRLSQEQARLPALALGFRDIGGTGLFASEYLVANKRVGEFDFSLGLGWGYLGSRGDVESPFSFVSDGFNERRRQQGSQGGDFNIASYFRGPMSVFGGAVWSPVNTPWQLKLELDGNDYQSEPQSNPQVQRSPFNVGATYRVTPNLDLSAGFERGDALMLGFTLHTNFRQLRSQAKLLDPAPVPLSTQPVSAVTDADWAAVASQIESQSGLRVRRILQTNKTVTVQAEQNAEHLPARALGRASRVLHNSSDDALEWFDFALESRGMSIINYAIKRDALVKDLSQPVPDELPNATIFAAPPSPAQGRVVYQTPVKKHDIGLGFNYSQNIGGPDAFILYQLNAELTGEYRFTRGFWVAGDLNYRLLDNYANFNFTAPSQLPRVRTFIREYLTGAKISLPNFQITRAGALGQNWFGMAYAGLLESMFGGAGAEVLWRPAASRFAVGVDLNYVQQRDFQQDFSFRDYRVVTGHATLYAKTGFEGVLAQVKVGRYLAGDIGATLDLSREFNNGIRMGAYATFTDVSAEEFGEGSFDKGIYVNLPLDLLLPTRTRSVAKLLYSPLTRDGGARLERKYTLYDLTQDRDTDRLFGNKDYIGQ